MLVCITHGTHCSGKSISQLEISMHHDHYGGALLLRILNWISRLKLLSYLINRNLKMFGFEANVESHKN